MIEIMNDYVLCFYILFSGDQRYTLDQNSVFCGETFDHKPRWIEIQESKDGWLENSFQDR